MPNHSVTQTITSASEDRKSVPVVTVESFFTGHAEKLQLRLEGPRVGFYRKIRRVSDPDDHHEIYQRSDDSAGRRFLTNRDRVWQHGGHSRRWRTHPRRERNWQERVRPRVNRARLQPGLGRRHANHVI